MTLPYLVAQPIPGRTGTSGHPLAASMHSRRDSSCRPARERSNMAGCGAVNRWIITQVLSGGVRDCIRYLAAFNDVQGTVRGAPPAVAETTVGEIVPAPQLSSQEYLMQDLPSGTITFLPPPLPHDGTGSSARGRQQQVATWFLLLPAAERGSRSLTMVFVRQKNQGGPCYVYSGGWCASYFSKLRPYHYIMTGYFGMYHDRVLCP